MILDSVELHNIAEARETEGEEGLLLQRVPEEVRQELWQGAANAILAPANSEIRFVIEEGCAEVTLSGPETSVRGFVFHGGFYANQSFDLSPEPTTIKIQTPARLISLPEEITKAQAFAPRVCRILLPYLAAGVRLHGVEGQVRPPAKGETPSLRLLTYGTSITHGAFATAAHLTYVAQAAWRLKADLLNLGVGGSCHCDPALADYIAQRDDWDVATLALSVNMLGFGFTAEDFAGRTRYFIKRLAESDAKRLVACITLFPFFGDVGQQMPTAKSTPEVYRQTLRDVVAEINLPNVVLIEGPDLLTDWSGLTADLIHPGDHGMIEMGENLAARLQEFL